MGNWLKSGSRTVRLLDDSPLSKCLGARLNRSMGAIVAIAYIILDVHPLYHIRYVLFVALR